MKSRQTLGYLGIYPKEGTNKHMLYKDKNMYNKNKSYVHALMDVTFIPYHNAPEDMLIDMADNDNNVYEYNLLGN